MFDEVKIKDKLVYDKNTSRVIGFTCLDETTNQLNTLSTSSEDFDPNAVATHMLVYMVRGIFVHIDFPFAQYATRNLSADEIFPTFWEVVRSLEMAGLRVIAATADGASPNRKFSNFTALDRNKRMEI